jgi:mono/diheme cytochrome c family protein
MALIVLAALSLIPFACIARSRAVRTPSPRVHIIPDMDRQPSFGPQRVNPLFADRRSARPPVRGTVAYGDLRDDEHLYRGLDGGDWAKTFPMPVDTTLLDRGRERFNIYCTPCHGMAGYGDGMVAKRADELLEAKWVPPASFHTDLVRSRPVGHLFNTVTHGIRNMPAYGSQIPERDRWAIVAYVRALQLSQHAGLDDVPAEERSSLR